MKYLAVILLVFFVGSAHAEEPKMLDGACDIVAGLLASDVSDQIYGDDTDSTYKRMRANIELHDEMDCESRILSREIEKVFRQKRRTRSIKPHSQPESRIHIIR